MTELRGIHLATLDKRRPVLVLTRHWGVQRLRRVVVAPITSTIRGGISEVAVGPANGLDHASVINLDNTQLVRTDDLGPVIGYLLTSQEAALTAAVIAAFDLEI